MSADSARYERLHAILNDARGLPAERRAAFLDEACAGDDALRAEAAELLAAATDDDPGDPFSDSQVDGVRRAFDGLLDGAAAPWMPERIGEYSVLRLVGQGGMGVVYEAEQSSPRRRVAIKLLHPLHATPERLRRFRREAELLGRLQHPGIAQIFEAGSYDVGRGTQPYIAMELVDGVDLRAHCEREGLDRRGCVALLAQVADAIQYAHEHGVIHRDLKPDNVLVDAHGQPKVLDFGIARVEGPSATLSTLITEEGQLVGTLAYMAPEQLEREPDAVTPQVDVYALGVLAFELLVGRLPFELCDLSISQALSVLTRSDPPRARDLAPGLRGDLDTILSKALEPDRERRYAGAAAFAADLRRHLDHQPIHARPPSRVYLARKFTRRHRGLVAGAVATLVVLVAGVITALVLADNAREQRDLAQENEQRARRGEREAVAGLLQASQVLLEAGRPRDAVLQLERVPEDARGVAWRLLDRRAPEVFSAHANRWFFLDDEQLMGLGAAGDALLLHSRVADRVIDQLPVEMGTALFGRRATCGLMPVLTSTERLLVDSRDGRVVRRSPRIVVNGLDRLRQSIPAVSDDGRTLLWPVDEADVDVARVEVTVDGELVYVLRDLGPEEWTDLCPEGRLLVINRRSGVRVLDLRTGAERLRYDAMPGAEAEGRAVREGVLLVSPRTDDAYDPRWIRLHPLPHDGPAVAVATPHDSGFPFVYANLYTIEYPRDGRYVVVSNEGGAAFGDALTGEPLEHPRFTARPSHPGQGGYLPFSEHAACQVRVSPSGETLVVSSGYGRGELLELPPAEPVVMRGHRGPPPHEYERDGWIYHLAVSTDGSLAASAAPMDPWVRLWDVRTGEQLAQLERTTDAPGAWGAYLAFDADDEQLLLTTPHDGPDVTLLRWSLLDGGVEVLDRLEQEANSHRGLLDAMLAALPPTPGLRLGQQVVRTGERAVVSLYPSNSYLPDEGPSSGRSWSPVPAWGGEGVGLDLHPDGRRVAVVGDRRGRGEEHTVAAVRREAREGELGVVTLADGEVERQRALAVSPWCAAYSPDGSVLAVGSHEGRVVLFETEEYTKQLEWVAHDASYVYALAWTPDGTRLVTASGDATLRVWDTRTRGATRVDRRRWDALRAALAASSDPAATYESAGCGSMEREAARAELIRRAHGR